MSVLTSNYCAIDEKFERLVANAIAQATQWSPESGVRPPELKKALEELTEYYYRQRHSSETLSVGCLSYWRHHENRCVRPRDHAGECYYVTPGRAIMENMDFKPPLPLVTDRMQGVDCPDCEDETPHQHAQKAGELRD